MSSNVLNVQSEDLFHFLSAEGKEKLVVVLFLNKKYSASSVMLDVLEELAFQVCRAVFVQVDLGKVGLSFDNGPYSLSIAPSYSFYYNSFRIDFTRSMRVSELNKKLQYWLDALQGSKLSSHGLLFPVSFEELIFSPKSDECEILYRICEEYKVNKKCDHSTVDYFFQFAPSLSLETLVEKYPLLFRVISWMIGGHIAEQETNVQLKLSAKLALHIAKINVTSAPDTVHRNYLKWLNSWLKWSAKFWAIGVTFACALHCCCTVGTIHSPANYNYRNILKSLT
ncbi:Glutaredoxin-3 [Trichinella spiralis]|uniref:Glutaredoxin-3 n=1 Tax=Trichinella spiralis TaxID=6334 RepID=A0ABR3K6B4_TRISP